MSNLELWSAVEKTDPKHVKAITGKSYQGSSPKPHYLVHKATETFGPCGIGWGFNIVSERIEEGAGGEKMHIAHVRLWYKWNGETGSIEHVGGTQFSGKRKSGQDFTDEDAPKKSVTDALVKALSMIGFAGDIFMGRYDDSKYVNEMRQEFSEERTTDQRAFPNKIHQEPKEAPKPEAPKITAAAKKELWASLMNDLKVESAKGTEAITRFMNDAEVKADIARLSDWSKNFREEAASIYKIAKEVENEFGQSVEVKSNYVPPSFDALDNLLEPLGDESK